MPGRILQDLVLVGSETLGLPSYHSRSPVLVASYYSTTTMRVVVPLGTTAGCGSRFSRTGWF